MRTLAFTFLVLLASGCSGAETREPLPSSGARLDRSIAFLVTATYTPSDPQAFNTPGRFSPAIDAKSVAARATAVAAERGGGELAPVSDAALLVNVARSDIKYEGQTAVFPFKIFFTIFFFPFDVPNYFIASDKFALVLQAKWKLVEKNQVVAEGIAEGKQGGRFGDLSRGWYFVGYLRMPSPLKGDEWQEIADALVPGAQDALAESLVLEVEKALAEKKGH